MKKNKKIEVPELRVEKGVISYGNAFICTKNISMISISPIPQNWLWIPAVIGALSLLPTLDDGGFFIFLFIVCLVAGICSIYNNATRGDNLAIALNSGETLYFNCKDRQFLHGVVQKMLKSIANENRSSYVIRFSNCSIQDVGIT